MKIINDTFNKCENCIFYEGCSKKSSCDLCKDYVRDLKQTVFKNLRTGQIRDWGELSETYEKNFTNLEVFTNWIRENWTEININGRV